MQEMGFDTVYRDPVYHFSLCDRIVESEKCAVFIDNYLLVILYLCMYVFSSKNRDMICEQH